MNISKTGKIKSYFFAVFAFAFLFLFAPITRGAELFLQTEKQTFGIGESFKVDLFLESPQESINAVEGKILFPAGLLELKEIRDGNSIINFWVEKPRDIGNEIIFSGIIPGGYQDTKGFLFSVIFQAKTIGNSAIEVGDAKILLNDGKGTLAKIAIFNFQFSILESALGIEPQIPSSINDRDPPEDFKPEIANDPSIFAGKWFLVFATQDKGSGIDHYEIQENRKQKIEAGNWKVAESPYILQDQKLRSFIYIKAIDKAGNERIATVEPRYQIRWYGQPLIWIIIAIIGIVMYLLWRRRKNK